MKLIALCLILEIIVSFNSRHESDDIAMKELFSYNVLV